MARKETYRFKHNQTLPGAEGAVKPLKKEFVAISPDIQLPFALGRALLIDKPLHWTSFDVVRKLRNVLQIKKIGHAGTLDPLATGLLIVCTGKFTKQINSYMAKEKEYTGHITLGAITPTFDLESTPDHFKDISHLTPSAILAATQQFIGVVQQLPPAYSALKKDGVAMYDLARKGITVEQQPRTITIHQFEITGIELPVIAFKVVCSTGTYIRSLANDFGAALGCGGYLSSLRRTRIGEFEVSNAIDVDTFIAQLRAGKKVIVPEQ